MREELLRNEEKKINFIVFLMWGVFIPIAACSFVMLFLSGTVVDLVVIFMVLSGVLIKLFENKLGPIAKYLYTCLMPFWGAIVLVVTNDGKFAAMTHAYFLATVTAIAYYNLSVVKVNAIVTVVVNVVAMIIFPEAYLKQEEDLLPLQKNH